MDKTVRMADAASRYPLIAAFTTLSHYGEEVGKRTVFYRNTDPMVDQPGWDIQLSKTGFTDEAGRCIVIEASMPNGPVIIALLGAASSRARSADLVSIRRWLEGNETPVTAPRVHYAGMSRHHHKTMVGAHESTMPICVALRPRRAEYKPISTAIVGNWEVLVYNENVLTFIKSAPLPPTS